MARRLPLLFLPLSLGLAATPTFAQVDVEAFALIPIQAVQTGTTPIVAGRSTFIRAAIRANGTVPDGVEVDGVLRVFIDGSEASFSPIYSTNGPIVPEAAPSPQVLTDTLNFHFVPPAASNVTLEFEVNPAGSTQVAESDFSNNSVSLGPLNFVCRAIPELVYVPIDHRPGGGPIPNLPDAELIRPGMGDNFIQSAYPQPDWEYRRSDAPSKLWTADLAVFSNGTALNNSLTTDLQMTSPQPDFIYGWVPGGLSYNGQAIIGGQAAMGNTEDIRYQRTFAHELGHNTGLFHVFGGDLGTVGVDVEHHLSEPLGLDQVMPPDQVDMMVAGQITEVAFVFPPNWQFFLDFNTFQCSTTDSVTEPENDQSLLIAGLFNTRDESFEFQHALTFGGGKTTPAADSKDANLFLRAFSGDALLETVPLQVISSADGCAACGGDHHEGPDHEGAHHGNSDSEYEPELAGFVSVLPAEIEGLGIDRVTVSTAKGDLLGELSRSANAPVAQFTGPDPIGLGLGPVVVSWTASDADGDALTSTLRYSPNGTRYSPLATAIEGNSARVDFSELPAAGPNGFLELLVSDGLRTTSTRLSGFATEEGSPGGKSAPRVHMLSPNNQITQPFGSTVFLHSSGWDLEDRALTGDDIQWFSDLDGPITSGRVTSTADLSVGTHVITVIGTDSTGLSTSDAAVVTITDRELPGDGGPITCQTDLGFGGPGTATLSFCGGDLSSGTFADLSIEGAPAFTSALLLGSFSQNPVPFAGGMILTNPLSASLPGVTDAAGDFVLPQVSGGGGPLTIYLQAIYVDDSQTFGLGITNALEAEFLP